MDNYVSDVVTGGGTGVMAGSVTAKGEVAKLSPAAAAAAAASKPTKLPRPEAVHKLFKDYDFDESGEIDLEELRDMISEMHTLAEGEPMPVEEAEIEAALVMKTLDVDNSGLLNEHEFVDWVMAGLRVPKAIRDASAANDDRGKRLQNFLHSVETLAHEMDDEDDDDDDANPILAPAPAPEPAPAKKKKGIKRTKTEVML